MSIAFAIVLQMYFCDPHSPWQRGTDESTPAEVLSCSVALTGWNLGHSIAPRRPSRNAARERCAKAMRVAIPRRP